MPFFTLFLFYLFFCFYLILILRLFSQPQVLGYLFWESEKKEITNELLNKYDSYLSEYVYEKLWNNLPNQEKTLLCTVCDYNETSKILKHSGITEKEYSVIRSRLIKRGLLVSNERGKISFSLPRFTEFVKQISLFY